MHREMDLPVIPPTTRTDSSPSGATVTVSGDLDAFTVACFVDPVRAAIEAEPATLVLDLTPVTFFGSAGLRALLETHDLARARGVRMGVVCGRTVDKVLEITETRALVEVYSTLDAALGALGRCGSR